MIYFQYYKVGSSLQFNVIIFGVWGLYWITNTLEPLVPHPEGQKSGKHYNTITSFVPYKNIIKCSHNKIFIFFII